MALREMSSKAASLGLAGLVPDIDWDAVEDFAEKAADELRFVGDSESGGGSSGIASRVQEVMEKLSKLELELDPDTVSEGLFEALQVLLLIGGERAQEVLEMIEERCGFDSEEFQTAKLLSTYAERAWTIAATITDLEVSVDLDLTAELSDLERALWGALGSGDTMEDGDDEQEFKPWHTMAMKSAQASRAIVSFV